MKNSIVILLFTLCSSFAFAQPVPDNEVPAAVKSAFLQKFSTATDVKWEKEDATEFEAEFKMDQKVMSANFSASGSWMETETELSYSQLPAPVKASFEKKHKATTKTGASKIELASGKTIYEIEINTDKKGSKGSKENELFFGEDGKLLKGSK